MSERKEAALASIVLIGLLGIVFAFWQMDEPFQSVMMAILAFGTFGFMVVAYHKDDESNCEFKGLDNPQNRGLSGAGITSLFIPLFLVFPQHEPFQSAFVVLIWITITVCALIGIYRKPAHALQKDES